MVPIYMARGLAAARHRELLAEAAGGGRRPAVVRGPNAVAPQAYGPLAI
jgi:hypothetical protein